MKKITIRQPDDFHLHIRQGKILKDVINFTANYFGRALVMPNTLPPIVNVQDVIAYRKEIVKSLPKGSVFEPLMTFKIISKTTPSMVDQLFKVGVIAGKLYPEGVTTNSEDGVSDFKALYPVFKEMEKLGLVLCLHGEKPGEFCLDRETGFIDILKEIVSNFPKLKIVLEHITTQEAVQAIKKLPKTVAATITLHHLVLTLDDVIGDKLSPHNFCKPVAKRPEDREALLKAATSGLSKFFLGTDSAPHPITNKENSSGVAGVYTAPVTIPLLAQIFEERKSLDKLEDFISRFGSEFYNLPLNQGQIGLAKKDWTVKDKYNGIIPFYHGQKISWEVKVL